MRYNNNPITWLFHPPEAINFHRGVILKYRIHFRCVDEQISVQRYFA